MPPSAFTESDQAYIKEWIAADRFLSSRWLSVSLELKEKRPINQHTMVEYELKFHNKSDEPIQINGIDHLCLVRRKVFKIDGEDMDYLQRPSGLIEVEEETPWGVWKNAYRFKLKPGRRSHGLSGPHILDEEKREEEVRVVWVRIKGPSLAGKTLYREALLRPTAGFLLVA